jgi:diadenylate cyclase
MIWSEIDWTRWLLAILDVVAVSFIFYRLLLLIQGTRAAQMIVGLVAIVAVSVLANWAQLDTLDALLSNLKTVWIVAFIVLFQPELRRALAQIGQSRLFRRFVRTESFGIVGHIVRASEEMSKRRIGAIVVIERAVGLKNYLETGVALNADVHADLLLSIFNVSSPLHDGAVIVVGHQIAAARCILPLTQTRLRGRALGTRHRAALGLSEESDAVVIAVSEESGRISIASEGTLTRMKDAGELRSYLSEVFSSTKKDVQSPWYRDLLERAGLPGASR